MDYLSHALIGFQACLEPANLLFCFVGVLVGTLVGVLPGIGPAGTVAILLPATFQVPPLASIIMLAGIYYGAQYGGSTTSILVNIPGESSSVVTCLDGYQMALQGKAGRALGIAAFASFIAGTISVIGLMLIAHPVAALALKFGPPEYFSLMVLGLTVLIYLAHKSVLKAMIMGAIGLIMSYIGLDLVSGKERFTFNIGELLNGVSLIPMVMGLLGVSEILENLEITVERTLFKTHIKGLLPSLRDWVDSAWPMLRGTVLGFFLGILPGGGGVIASFVSYGVEKRCSSHPETFGKGAIEGVAGPEAANNAGATGAFVPLLTLGIPSNMTMGVLFAGLLVHNITPGPFLVRDHPDIFWGVITSMYLGNVMLLVLNLPLIGIWVQITKVPFKLLFPLIILCCLIGVYSINGSIFDLWVMIVSGVFGYLARKCDYEPAPLVLAFILGPLLDQALRQSLILSDGSPAIFVVRPISAFCLAVAVLLLLLNCFSYFRKRRSGTRTPATS